MDYTVTVDLTAPPDLVPLDDLRMAGVTSLLRELLGQVEGMGPDSGGEDEHARSVSVGLDDYRVASFPEGCQLFLFVEAASLATAEASCRQLTLDLLSVVEPLAEWEIERCAVDLNPHIAERQLAQADFEIPDRIPDEPADDGHDVGPAANRARVLAAARGMRGFDAEAFGGGRDAGPEQDERAHLAMGALMIACEIMTDDLFIDVHTLTGAGKDASSATVDHMWVIDNLPPQNGHLYTASFARKFLLSTTAVVDRLAGDWEPCSNLAEELALRLLIEQAESVIELWTERSAAEFDGAFRAFEDAALDDPDHARLMDFASWFVPFDDRRSVHPYCLPDPAGQEPDSASWRT